jgi:hypothetical protein
VPDVRDAEVEAFLDAAVPDELVHDDTDGEGVTLYTMPVPVSTAQHEYILRANSKPI